MGGRKREKISMFWDDPCTRLWVGVGVEEGGQDWMVLYSGVPQIVAGARIPRMCCWLPVSPWLRFVACPAARAMFPARRNRGLHTVLCARPSLCSAVHVMLTIVTGCVHRTTRVFVHFTLSLSYSTSLTLLLSLSFSLSYCLSTFPFMAVEPGKATLGRGVP